VAGVKNYAQFSTISIEQEGFPKRQPLLRFLFESLAQLNHQFRTDDGAIDLGQQTTTITAA